jgi:hypothetical protein
VRLRSRWTQGFDEQHFKQVCQDDISRRALPARFLGDQFHQHCQPAFTANVYQLGQQRYQ